MLSMRLHYPTLSSNLQSRLIVHQICYFIDLAGLQVTASRNDQVRYSRAESYATAQERSRFAPKDAATKAMYPVKSTR